MAIGDVLRSFLSPAQYPFGIAWSGERLWIHNMNPAVVYEIDPQTGEELTSFPSSGANGGRGIAFSGTHLYAIHAIAPATMYKIHPNGHIVDTFPLVGGGVYWGLTWNGLQLWSSVLVTNVYRLLDPRDGAILDEFPFPGLPNTPDGVAWDGRLLWGCSSGSYLNKVDPVTGTLVWRQVGSPPLFSDIASDGHSLYGTSSIDGLVYQVSMS
jgi:outer membrane protein assembly factor BamB